MVGVIIITLTLFTSLLIGFTQNMTKIAIIQDLEKNYQENLIDMNQKLLQYNQEHLEEIIYLQNQSKDFEIKYYLCLDSQK